MSEIVHDLFGNEEQMILPEQYCCRDCVYFDKCKWLVGAKPEWRECDFNPMRFHLKESHGED